MQRPFVAALALLMLSGCDQAEGQAKKLVADSLRDPASAQFREVEKVLQDDGRYVVCGEVNGKNAYGAYSGFTGFIVDGHQVKMAPEVQVTVSDIQASTEFIRTQTELCIEPNVRRLTSQVELAKARAAN